MSLIYGKILILIYEEINVKSLHVVQERGYMNFARECVPLCLCVCVCVFEEESDEVVCESKTKRGA